MLAFSKVHYRGFSRIGGRVHRDLVARVKHGSEPGENLGHRGGEDHVPGGQEERWDLMLVLYFSGRGLILIWRRDSRKSRSNQS